MSKNFESAPKKMIFPMPMSELRKYLSPILNDKETLDITDSFFSSEASDDSFHKIVLKKPSQVTKNKLPTSRETLHRGFFSETSDDSLYQIDLKKVSQVTNNKLPTYDKRIQCVVNFAKFDKKNIQIQNQEQKSFKNECIEKDASKSRNMTASNAATSSHLQGEDCNNNSEAIFESIHIKNKDYIFIKKLGTGGSSEVYKVLELGTNSEFALKCVYLCGNEEISQSYISEVELLRQLNYSDRVVHLYDYEFYQNKIILMVLEAGETNMYTFLKVRGNLPLTLVLYYWEEMLHAVNFIHSRGIIHADLKPANFLLVNGQLKLIDFGLSSVIPKDATGVDRPWPAGTFSYMSPEALMVGAGRYESSDKIKISFHSDVWSLGCILYRMVYGETPFGHILNLRKWDVIVDPNHNINYPKADNFPLSLILSLKWCLTYKAVARPSVQELLDVKHLLTYRAMLPPHLLKKVKESVTKEEFRLLEQAQL